MPDLARFQSAFAEALLATEPLGGMAHEPGFAVYRNTAARGAIEALRDAYPTVDALIGQEAFTQAALGYRAEQPPSTPVLARYGAGFAEFLASLTWLADLPYLGDVARLDRLWIEAHLAADEPSRIAARSNIAFGLILHPATRFAWLDTPAVTIWLAHRRPGGFDALEPEWRPEGALFTRRQGSVDTHPIGLDEYRLLVAVAAGAAVEDFEPNPSAGMASHLVRLIACGAVQPA